MPILRTLEQNFFATWSQAMAYVLGYFAADGCMHITKRGGHFIEFTSIDRILLESVQTAVGSNHQISPLLIRNPNQMQQYRLRIGSKKWFQNLLDLGFVPNKSYVLAFPNVPDEYIGAFIRGYFDGDGCVYFNQLKYADRKSKRWILLTLFTSGSLQFLKNMHEKLKFHGIKGGSVIKRRNAYDLKFSHADSLALYRLMYNTSEVASFYLPRKREKFEEAIRVLGLDKELRS